MARPLHIHVEEPSMEAFLEGLLPRALGPLINWRIINHGSKTQLLAQIPNRLKGYANCTNVAVRPKALILVDRDSDDCLLLKNQLENACHQSGLTSKTSPAADGMFEVVNRIVIEELEAWYFGETAALRVVFPSVPATLPNRQAFRDPDAVAGGTHERLLTILQNAGYFKGLTSLPKIDTARRMGSIVDINGNRSTSFNHFVGGLRALANQA